MCNAKDVLLSQSPDINELKVKHKLHRLSLLLDMEFKYMTNWGQYQKTIRPARLLTENNIGIQPYARTIMETVRFTHLGVGEDTKLDQLARAGLGSDRLMSTDYDIHTNILSNPEDNIVLISDRFLEGNDVITSLIIAPDVYRNMQLLGNIQISSTVEVQMGRYPNTAMVDENGQDWYIGYYVSPK